MQPATWKCWRVSNQLNQPQVAGCRLRHWLDKLYRARFRGSRSKGRRCSQSKVLGRVFIVSFFLRRILHRCTPSLLTYLDLHPSFAPYKSKVWKKKDMGVGMDLWKLQSQCRQQNHCSVPDFTKIGIPPPNPGLCCLFFLHDDQQFLSEDIDCCWKWYVHIYKVVIVFQVVKKYTHKSSWAANRNFE